MSSSSVNAVLAGTAYLAIARGGWRGGWPRAGAAGAGWAVAEALGETPLGEPADAVAASHWPVGRHCLSGDGAAGGRYRFRNRRRRHVSRGRGSGCWSFRVSWRSPHPTRIAAESRTAHESSSFTPWRWQGRIGPADEGRRRAISGADWLQPRRGLSCISNAYCHLNNYQFD